MRAREGNAAHSVTQLMQEEGLLFKPRSASLPCPGLDHYVPRPALQMPDLPVPIDRPGEQPHSSQSSRLKWASTLTGRSHRSPSESSQRG